MGLVAAEALGFQAFGHEGLATNPTTWNMECGPLTVRAWGTASYWERGLAPEVGRPEESRQPRDWKRLCALFDRCLASPACRLKICELRPE